MESAIAQQQQQERLQDMLDASSRLIATRPMSLDTIDSAAQALDELNDAFPGNLSAANQRADLIRAINSDARQVGAGGSEDAGFVLLNRGLRHFEGNQQLLATRAELQKSKDDRLAQERVQRAARMGQLAIDAVPWGEVTEIKDSQGNTVQVLPTSRSTPMLVSLEAGNYTVSIKNSDGGSPQNLSVSVVAQQVETAIAEFESLTADEYFERSSWWQ